MDNLLMDAIGYKFDLIKLTLSGKLSDKKDLEELREKLLLSDSLMKKTSFTEKDKNDLALIEEFISNKTMSRTK